MFAHKKQTFGDKAFREQDGRQSFSFPVTETGSVAPLTIA